MSPKRWCKDSGQMVHLCNEDARELTRACVEEALLRLLREKSYKDISVTDIAAKAGVSRGAYYRNYESREDVLRCILRSKFQEVHKQMLRHYIETEPSSFWQGMFDEFLKERELYELVIRAGQETLLLDCFKQMSAVYIANSELRRHTPERMWHYQALFFAGAAYTIIVDWLKNGTKESPAEMARMMSIMEKTHSDLYF